MALETVVGENGEDITVEFDVVHGVGRRSHDRTCSDGQSRDHLGGAGVHIFKSRKPLLASQGNQIEKAPPKKDGA